MFVNGMENHRLDSITPELIETYLVTRKVTPGARAAELKVIKAFFHWAGARPQSWLSLIHI